MSGIETVVTKTILGKQDYTSKLKPTFPKALTPSVLGKRDLKAVIGKHWDDQRSPAKRIASEKKSSSAGTNKGGLSRMIAEVEAEHRGSSFGPSQGDAVLVSYLGREASLPPIDRDHGATTFDKAIGKGRL